MRTDWTSWLRAVGLLAFLASSSAHAESIPTLRDATSVRAAGMAGATRGFAEDIDALLVNPAAISGVPHLSFSANAIFDSRQHASLYSVGVVDSKLNAQDPVALAGGFAYHRYQSGEGDDQRDGSLYALSFSVPLKAQMLFLGATAKYLKLSGAVNTSAITGDVGLLFKPIPLLGISAVGYNLIDIHSAEAKRAWGAGVAIGSPAGFHLDGDVRLDTRPDGQRVASWSVGAEYLLGGLIMPRLGYADDRLRDAHLMAAGVSLVFSGLAIDAAYRYAIGGDERCLGISLRIVDWPM